MTQKEALYKYTLRLADSGLILGQRLGEWCGHGPALEEDIALTNIALDLLGQSNSFFEYAGKLGGENKSADDLAFLRKENEYMNFLMVEQANGHFGDTIARQFLFDAFNYFNFQFLAQSADENIAGISQKAIKEVTYHIRHSREWMLRLGDGTEESKLKIQSAIDNLWMYTGEFFKKDEIDEIMHKAGIAPDLDEIKKNWHELVSGVLDEATLKEPGEVWMLHGGKQGKHTENLGYILTDLQYMQRTYPNSEW